MENKLKKRQVKHFIFALIGYLFGTIVSDLILSKDEISRVLIGIMFAAVARGLLELYETIKHPKLKEKQRQLDKDERLIVIKNKAAYSIFNITIFILAIAWIVSVIKEYDNLLYFASILIIVMTFGIEICKYYWSKKI